MGSRGIVHGDHVLDNAGIHQAENPTQVITQLQFGPSVVGCLKLAA